MKEGAENDDFICVKPIGLSFAQFVFVWLVTQDSNINILEDFRAKLECFWVLNHVMIHNKSKPSKSMLELFFFGYMNTLACIQLYMAVYS